MSDTFKRRRKRRTGSTSVRYSQSQLIPIESVGPTKIGKSEIAACAAVGTVAIMLVTLIWVVTAGVAADQGDDIRERAESALSGQAATIAETVSQELQVIDQSLSIIQSMWKADSNSVDLKKWQDTMPALVGVSDDLFIADENGVIHQDILPQAIGQAIGAPYITFQVGALETFERDGTHNRESLTMQENTGSPVEARRFLVYVVRPLDHPKGWVLGASFRSMELTKLFAAAGLGYNSVVALVDMKTAALQAVAGPSARRPVIDLSKKPLYAAMGKANAGIWVGQSGIDDVERLHAFRIIPDRNVAVVVGAGMSEVMAPAENLEVATRILASIASAFVMIIAGLVLWQLSSMRSARRRQKAYDRHRSEVDRLRVDETTYRARAKLDMMRFDLVLSNASDGFAVFDANLHLMQWNPGFQNAIGVGLQRELPLDMMLRAQLSDADAPRDAAIEAEIVRRTSILLSGDPAGLSQRGTHGEDLILRGLPVEDGGVIFLVNGFSTWQQAPVRSEMLLVEDEPPTPNVTQPAPIEW